MVSNNKKQKISKTKASSSNDKITGGRDVSNEIHHHHQQQARPQAVATTTKQTSGYFTVQGIQNEISLIEENWPCYSLKELMDNAYDWLNENYPAAILTAPTPVNSSNNNINSSVSKTTDGGKIRREIAVKIRIEPIPNDPEQTHIFRIAVRNSNVNKLEVFGGNQERLEHIYDYSQWLSTKRYQHAMTVGALGDYLKRHGGMAYASWSNIARVNNEEDIIDITKITDDINEEEADNPQWKEPIIFRFNGSEYRVFVYYDRNRGEPKSVIEYTGNSDAIEYTEVECALPVSNLNCVGSSIVDTDRSSSMSSTALSPPSLFDRLLQYYRLYKVPKIDIKFSIKMQSGERYIHEESEEV